MYLHSIEFSEKEALVDIDDAARSEAEYPMAAGLKKDGFKHFIKCRSDIIELSRQAVAKICPLQLIGVDAVIYSTDSSWENNITAMDGIDSCLPAQGQRNGLLSVLDDFGLNVIPYGVNFSACDNLGRALCLAKALLNSQTHANILVIIGDKTEPGYSRFTLSGSALYSDCVGAFILSDKKPEQKSYLVESISYEIGCAISKLELSASMKKMMHTKKMIKGLKDKFAQIGHQDQRLPADYDKVIMGHYNDDFVESMCVMLEVDTKNVVREYSRDYAHCYAIDPLIALKNLPGDENIVDGETVLQLTSAAEMTTLCGYRFCE